MWIFSGSSSTSAIIRTTSPRPPFPPARRSTRRRRNRYRERGFFPKAPPRKNCDREAARQEFRRKKALHEHTCGAFSLFPQHTVIMKGRFCRLPLLEIFSWLVQSVQFISHPLEKLQRRKAKGFTDGIDRGDGGIPFSFYDSTDIAILQIRKIREGRFGHLSFFSDFFDCNASGFQ